MVKSRDYRGAGEPDPGPVIILDGAWAVRKGDRVLTPAGRYRVVQPKGVPRNDPAPAERHGTVTLVFENHQTVI